MNPIPMRSDYLKFTLRLAIATVLAAHAVGALDAADYQKMTPQEAETLLQEYVNPPQFREFAARAMQSRRLEVIEVAFRNQYTMRDIREQTIKLEDMAFKDAVVLMMLKSDSSFWPPDEPSPFSSRSRGIVREPWEAVYLRHFPGQAFDAERLLKRRDRLQLASELAAAMKKDEKRVGGNEPTAPSPR